LPRAIYQIQLQADKENDYDEKLAAPPVWVKKVFLEQWEHLDGAIFLAGNLMESDG